jgi:hypothetical protein
MLPNKFLHMICIWIQSTAMQIWLPGAKECQMKLEIALSDIKGNVASWHFFDGGY